ncbi:helix-turn-helix domain-containing protein [Streptococcus cuniculi]|uniref:XRE family transcriptional regulator n=1 Tax=Streptococcus cuniculi TaxID=1432788 RepID=A0A4Y9JC49_9STRE|nr:XRE family transcriptional regulator [Streptococcus cuniculi]MBF0778262.1 helix-turn-helix domain-containing protein [Streptococcus cuniculi]TFU97758.1 XRE family transcriptional regulator [Streptococcus cuniculi]
MRKEGFGEKVRRLREERGWTREQFCDDELELTVRQLTRIELGVSKPTLTKIFFIAHRLGMSLFELMPDYVDLPNQYVKLKYDILRTPTYDQFDLIEKRNEKLLYVYEHFYDSLPDRERVALDALQSTIDVLETKSDIFGREIVKKHIPQIERKRKYDVNDLLVIHLFMEHAYLSNLRKKSDNRKVFLKLMAELPKQVMMMEPEDLFVLRNVMFATIRVLGAKGIYDPIPTLFQGLDQIMQITQDFQKYPIFSMLRWKYELLVHRDVNRAHTYCKEAMVFAKLMGNLHLMEQLQAQWRRDTSDFATFLSC